MAASAFLERRSPAIVTRRQFHALAAGSLAALTPTAAHAAPGAIEVTETETDILVDNGQIQLTISKTTPARLTGLVFDGQDMLAGGRGNYDMNNARGRPAPPAAPAEHVRDPHRRRLRGCRVPVQPHQRRPVLAGTPLPRPGRRRDHADPGRAGGRPDRDDATHDLDGVDSAYPRRYYTKYDWATWVKDHVVHGLYGNGYGIWVVQPNREAFSGGPVRQDLNLHQTTSRPVLLVEPHGTHYGSPPVRVAAGQDWAKTYGPTSCG